jgi:hypothetical protein
LVIAMGVVDNLGKGAAVRPVIVVDTNVISELMRGEPHPALLSWLAAQPRSLLYTMHVCQAENSKRDCRPTRGTPAHGFGGSDGSHVR